jgi:hypothetical protein
LHAAAYAHQQVPGMISGCTGRITFNLISQSGFSTNAVKTARRWANDKYFPDKQTTPAFSSV